MESIHSCDFLIKEIKIKIQCDSSDWYIEKQLVLLPKIVQQNVRSKKSEEYG